MPRSRLSVLSAVFAVVAMQWAPAAYAQGLEIAPIGFDVGQEDDTLVLAAFAAPTDAPLLGLIQNGPTPVAARALAGLPQPSIIVGLIAPGREAELGLERLLPATVQQVGFPLDDLAARDAMRNDDPDMFRRLVTEGHLDPETNQLNRALQIELARMNCYRSGIDGAWGPGSRRSVGAYFDLVPSVSWPDPAPTNGLLHAILMNGDVACPTPPPVAVAATPRSTRATTTQRSTSTRTTRAPTPRATAPATKAKPKLTIGGTGVLR